MAQIETLVAELSKRKIKRSSYNTICDVSLQCGIDQTLLLSIYLIETHFRPFYIRFAEYLTFAFSYIVNQLTKRHIKNYTLGPFQIGITSILIDEGYGRYKVHDRTIAYLSIKEVICVIRKCRFRNNLLICCSIITRHKSKIEEEWGKTIYNIGRLGECYNGKKVYGVLLLMLTEELEKRSKIV